MPRQTSFPVPSWMRACDPRALSPSFRSNEACDLACRFLHPCETRPPPGRHVDRPGLSRPPTSKYISQRGRRCVSHLLRPYAAHEQVPSAWGYQPDLFLREGADLLAADDDDTDHLAFLKHRDGKDGSCAPPR